MQVVHGHSRSQHTEAHQAQWQPSWKRSRVPCDPRRHQEVSVKAQDRLTAESGAGVSPASRRKLGQELPRRRPGSSRRAGRTCPARIRRQGTTGRTRCTCARGGWLWTEVIDGSSAPHRAARRCFCVSLPWSVPSRLVCRSAGCGTGRPLGARVPSNRAWVL